MNIFFEKNRIILVISLFLIFTIAGSYITACDIRHRKIEEHKARKLYDSNKFDESIILFREIILSSNNTAVKREAYFWIAKAYMSVSKYNQAESNLEHYLSNYKDTGSNYPEAVYQKGRLLFLQEEYERSIEQLNLYINDYKDHELISNGYYWIGEALYALGQFEDSEFYFKVVIEKYPKSHKFETSKYKLRLIEHKKSELVLQNLLKWSQEQYLAPLNKFKIKEKSLRQALEEYEKNKEQKIDTVEAEKYSELVNENEELKKRISKLEDEITDLVNMLTQNNSDFSNQLNQLKLKEQLLNQKEETLLLLDKELKEKEKQLER